MFNVTKILYVAVYIFHLSSHTSVKYVFCHLNDLQSVQYRRVYHIYTLIDILRMTRADSILMNSIRADIIWPYYGTGPVLSRTLYNLDAIVSFVLNSRVPVFFFQELSFKCARLKFSPSLYCTERHVCVCDILIAFYMREWPCF